MLAISSILILAAGACNGVEQPLVKMQAHSAPLGLAFYTAKEFPASYRGLFVAFHGSWNRSVPTGYKVIFLPLDSAGISLAHRRILPRAGCTMARCRAAPLDRRLGQMARSM